MGAINFIRENWFRRFLVDGSNELRKKIFCTSERFITLLKWKKWNSYSQYCEDLFILRFFKYKKGISYIDIGSHDPDFLSNTKKIYEEYDWTGVNIEANPWLIEAFNVKRTKDKNLNIGIWKKGILPFGISTESSLSSFSPDTIEGLKQRWILKEMIEVEVFELPEIFDRFSIDTNVDILSVDVEWLSLEVLKTNDWKKFRPKLICVENDIAYNTDITTFLSSFWYKKTAYNGLNTFYKDANG